MSVALGIVAYLAIGCIVAAVAFRLDRDQEIFPLDWASLFTLLTLWPAVIVLALLWATMTGLLWLVAPRRKERP